MPVSSKERPVIMIGAERSGTTLVMAMLGCHPRIAVPEVVWYYPRFRPYLHTYGNLAKNENFRTLVEAHRAAGSSRAAALLGTGALPLDDILNEAMRSSRPDYRPRQ